MNSGTRIGFFGILLVVILSLVAGGVGGAVAAMTFAKPKPVVVNAPAVQPAATTLGQPSERPMSWVDVAQRDGPAVVTIVNQQQPTYDVFGNVVPGGTAEGSGFIIDHKGDIVTNDHVVSDEQSLTVIFADGHKAPAHLVAADQYNDLAVVKVNVPVPAVLHFATATPLPGEPVLAIGSALGEYRNSVTSGVVSALGRTINEPNNVTLHNMIQTDAPINEGNSGGPLLNDLGQVIGVNTAIMRGSSSSNDIFGFGLDESSSVVAEGLGFAIPASTAKNVVARLVQHKPPAFLGVTYQEVTPQAATYYNLPIGAYINSVKPGSPAAKAGLKARDIITKLDGHPINSSSDLEQMVTSHAPGDIVTLNVWRNGKTLTLKAKLGVNG